jgi:sporulation protein YlmC with PRC-barrel domain
MRLSDETLHNRTVISADGKAIGSISELFISTSDWRIESIRVELHKDIAQRIGATRSLFRRGTVEVPVSFIQSVSDAVVLSVDVEELREVQRAPVAEAPSQHST